MRFDTKEDIVARARLATNHYTRFLDSALNWIPYFYARLYPEGAWAEHCEWDFGDATGRYLDAIALCRQMTGDGFESEGTAHLTEALAGMFSEGDGLCYRSRGHDWVEFGANVFDQRSTLLGLVSWYRTSGDRKALNLATGLVEGLRRIVVDRDDHCFFPYIDYRAGMERNHYRKLGNDVDPLHFGGGVLIHPLVRFFEDTGDRETLRLAGKLSRFVIDHAGVYGADGDYWAIASPGLTDCDGHVHSRVDAMGGVLRYALHQNDREMIAWSKQVYDWTRTIGGSSGWFPEYIGLPGNITKHSEICCTTDMIHAAIHLARAGFSECWDHAERYLNHLLASQVTDISWAIDTSGREETDQIGRGDIAQRYLGGFTGRNRPNDQTNDGYFDTMGCCAAAGGRGLYLAWRHAVDIRADDLFVNLWLTRHDEIAELESDIPDQGLLSLKLKKSCRPHVRLPGWLDPVSLQATRDGTIVSFDIRDGYIHLPVCERNTVIELRFPLVTALETEQIAGDLYEISWKGNVVTGIDPGGSHMPFYGL